GSEMPLEGTASGYPSWMFTLPVRTRELVLWPMLQGMAVVALLGEVWAQGVLRPCGYEVPLGIPAALLAAVVAMMQALLWMPFPLPWLRLVVALLVMPPLVILPQFWFVAELDRVALFVVLGGLLPLAFVVALFGVTRARSGAGAGASWQWLAGRTGRAARREATPFSSPESGQVWLELRQPGQSGFLTPGGILLLSV